MYKLLKDITTGEIFGVLKDGITSIPFAPDNTDYQAYLKHIAEGGVVLPADDNEQTA
jgi:hypothetical protein